MTRRAFTLIELLVVVAIIAILAAIALPNFLNAMTRSKIARTKSDLRTITTGLEAYFVDNNRYPPDAQMGVVPYLRRLTFITSPVAYLSSVPGDPFADMGRIKQHSAAKGTNPYTTDGGLNSPIIYPLAYDFANRRTAAGGYESANTWAKISGNPQSVQWGMRGIGPDKWPAWLGEDAIPYDPTNGTVSYGSIFWTGPGKGEDIPKAL